ncbi:MAG: hypothetical protein HQ553_16565 [Chloroflexi bacterium]|nr:hypothetical protein [Chloroflexota bacterium]
MAAGEDSTPHENPDDAEVYYDGIAILGYYTQLLDHVLRRAPDEVEVLHEKGPFTNVPDGLRDSLRDFGEASVEISTLIVDIEANLDEMNELAIHSRFEELLVLADEVQERLIDAYVELSTLETSVIPIEYWLNIFEKDSSQQLVRMYQELHNRIADLSNLLELLQEMMNTAPGMPGMPGMTIEEILALLNPTEISLEVEPQTAFVGERIQVAGSLETERIELPNRQIVILLDGVPYAEMQTSLDGKYKGAIQLPYEYVPQMTVQALYYPRDDDVGTYLASKSESVEVEVLFYSASLELEVEGKVYPGLANVIVGRFDYGEDPVLEKREVEVYLDGRLITRISADDSFEITITIDPDMVLGEHRLMAISPAKERYAPVMAETVLEVVKIVPVIDLSPPSMAIMPFEMKVSGRVHSEDEPLGGITVRAKFSGHEETAVTSEDGSFSMKMATASLDISLVGSKKLEVEAYSERPWISRSSNTWKMVTLNPILIGLVLVVLAFVLVISIKRIRVSRRKRGIQPGVLVPKPAMGTVGLAGKGVDVGSHSIDELVEQEENDDRRIILTLYTKVLKLIQGLTGTAMKPQTTLREFTRQSATMLGPAYSYLDRFTRLVERLLYSKHTLEPSDVDEGRELNQMIEGAVAGSDGQPHNR